MNQTIASLDNLDQMKLRDASIHYFDDKANAFELKPLKLNVWPHCMRINLQNPSLGGKIDALGSTPTIHKLNHIFVL